MRRPMQTDLIPLVRWAEEHGKDPGNMRRLAQQGRLSGAVKLGRDWLVPRDAVIVSVPTGGAVHRHTP